MSRDPELYLQEIKDCASKILHYCQGLDRESFEDHGMAYDAVLRNLEIIGEASKNLPKEIRDLAPEIPWRMICGFRDHLAHAYFGLDDDTVWEVVAEEVPPLLAQVERMMKRLPPKPPTP
jgi:uncharacterized protein with HEPN domain